MSRHTQRDIVLLMAREIDPQEGAPEDDEYISEWVPEHSCGGAGDPTCAACWVQSYDDRTEWEFGIREDGHAEPFTDHYEDIETMREEFDGTLVWHEREHIARRQKAGPWMKAPSHTDGAP